jgi:hypothetical protein
MPSLQPQTPTIRYSAVSGTAVVLDFGQKMGAAYIKNMGPASVALAFDATPTAGYANGQYVMAANEAVNLDDILYQTLNFIALSGGNSTVQAIGLVRGA